MPKGQVRKWHGRRQLAAAVHEQRGRQHDDGRGEGELPFRRVDSDTIEGGNRSFKFNVNSLGDSKEQS